MPRSDKMHALASSSQDLPLRNSKERHQWQRAEGAPVSQNRGYDPQKHKEMSKPYLRTCVHSSGFLGTRDRFSCDSGWYMILA